MNENNDTTLFSRGDLVEWRDIDADIYTASGLAPKNEYSGNVTWGGTKFKRYQGYIMEVTDDIATVLVSFEMKPQVYEDLYKTEISHTEFYSIKLQKPETTKYPLIMLRLIKKNKH
jgi:hypothetical protein